MNKSPKYFLQIPVKISKLTDINSTDKLVYAVVHTMLNVTDQFYVSSKNIGIDVGMNRRSVIRSLNSLKNHRLISTKTVHDSKFKYGIRRYIYDLHSANKDSDKDVTRNSDKGVTNSSDKNVTRSSDRDVTQKDYLKDYKKRLSNNNLPQQKAERDFKKVDAFVHKHWVASIPSNKKFLIDRLINKYGCKAVISAMTTTLDNGIGIMGMPKYTASVLKNNAHKPKRKTRTYYGNQPVKQKLPKWATEKYDPKKHKADPKLIAKIEKHVKQMQNESDKNEKH